MHGREVRRRHAAGHRRRRWAAYEDRPLPPVPGEPRPPRPRRQRRRQRQQPQRVRRPRHRWRMHNSRPRRRIRSPLLLAPLPAATTLGDSSSRQLATAPGIPRCTLSTEPVIVALLRASAAPGSWASGDCGVAALSVSLGGTPTAASLCQVCAVLPRLSLPCARRPPCPCIKLTRPHPSQPRSCDRPSLGRSALGGTCSPP